uniref:Wsv308-like protein n=1 Tax=Hemigrapsus takanoi nimavirus TaxID=2133792 RepID=A0A401IP39_9VIRU|nr:MAG: wsv308-like protein [Hemigrapsus takanoi nimavirus]GBG35376.1 wsv308-like protein [Hemigrapsus takanoi nimavirus]
MSSADASRVFEQYLLESTNAIVNVARNVESFSDVFTPQDAELTSAILFGTPKPSAGDVASLVNYKRRQVPKDELSSNILNAVSVTKFGQEYHNKRAERNMSEIFGYINRLPVPGKVSVYRSSGYGCGLSGGGASTKALTKMRDHNSVNIGLTMAGDPVLDKEKYVSGSTDPRATAETIGMEQELDEAVVKTTLLDMFSLLEIESDDIDSLIKLTKMKAIKIAIRWAESVEKQLLSSFIASVDQQQQHQVDQTLTEMYMSDAKEGIHSLCNLVRDTFFRPASQLTRVQDVDDMQANMKKCVSLINVNALERMVSALLFYSCFEVLDSPQETIALEGGVIKKKKIIKRSTNNIFVALCFFFQNFRTSYADALFGLDDLVNHRSYTEGIARSLLSGYTYDFDGPWTTFNHVLDKRREVINRSPGVREDVLDCRVHLSSPMYAVVSDALGSVRQFVDSLENFLLDVRDKYLILESYYNVRSGSDDD